MAQVFDGTLGAAFLGHYMTAILFGITSMQTWVYFKEKNTDPIWLRSMVLVLWFLDGVHTTLLTSAVYYDLSHFGDLLAIFKVYWSIPVMIIVTGVSNTIVRGIFAYRLWKLSNGGILVPAVIGVLSLYHTGDSLYFAITGFSIPSYFAIREVSWSLYAGFSCEIVADGIITVFQYLILRRFRTGIRSTDSVIQVLMIYTINTCLVTSLCEILCLITYAALPSMFVYWAFYFVSEKLYINALLANLNARGSLWENLTQPVHESNGETAVPGLFTMLEFADTPSISVCRCAHPVARVALVGRASLV